MNMDRVIKETLKEMKIKNYDTKIQLVWCAEDIIITACQRGIVLTAREVYDCLGGLASHHDCTIGVSWDNVNAEIDWAIDERE